MKTSEVVADLSGIFQWTFGGVFQGMFTFSVAFSKGLSLSLWVVTGIFSGISQRMFTSLSSDVQYFARSWKTLKSVPRDLKRPCSAAGVIW